MRIVYVLLVFHALAVAGSAQPARKDMLIPVRDGSSIAADLYSSDTTVARPVILIQTPYNKNLYRLGLGYGIGGAMPFDPAKYHYVITDWRGFYGSSAAPAAGYDRGLDGYDIMQWLGAQKWCNGKIGTWGASALGAIQFQTARHHPPQHVCAVPLVKDFKTKYGDYYYGGAFRREHVESLERLGFITADLVTSHPTEDLVWRAAEQASDYPEEIDVPMLVVGGWFDHFPNDVLRAFSDLQQRSDPAVRDQHRMIMGPWTHSGVDQEQQGELSFPDAVNFARDEALRFFGYHLLGEKNGWPTTANLRYYDLGADEGSRWKDAQYWSGLGPTEYWFRLHGEGQLVYWTPPDTGSAYTDLVADPRNPVPSHGSARFNPFDPSVEAGPLDIRTAVESHPHAYAFTAERMPDNLHVLGRMEAVLHVSTDRPDADVCVRVCDVYPDGRSIILTEGIRRLRFRNGYGREQLCTPDSVYRVVVPLQDLAWTPHEGHRLRLVLSGSNWPRFDVNPNSGGPLYAPGDSLVATLRIHHSAEYPSRIVFDSDLSTNVEPAAAPARSAIDVWPQPYDGHGPLHFRTGAGRGTLFVHDMLGRTLARISIDGMDPTGDVCAWQPPRRLAPGLYLLHFQTARGTTAGKFLVRQ